MGAVNEQPGDEQRLDDAYGDASDDVPFVEFPEGWLPEFDETSRRQAALAESPAPERLHVKHHDVRHNLRSNILWPLPIENTQPEFSDAPAYDLEIHQAPANNSLTEVSSRDAIDGGA